MPYVWGCKLVVLMTLDRAKGGGKVFFKHRRRSDGFLGKAVARSG